LNDTGEIMTDKTKLLKMVENALQTAPPNEEAEAQAVIDATADWFEEVLQSMGITPSCIPTLLRYQAHQHEYLNDD
jgi:membrane-bound ClpP family serine protease